ncbi:MAG: hypothetical protein QF681_16740, partial [Vicinamibacterales bacterium]|nr:hypothetical protein [Vicinamibacterales bacterium]
MLDALRFSGIRPGRLANVAGLGGPCPSWTLWWLTPEAACHDAGSRPSSGPRPPLRPPPAGALLLERLSVDYGKKSKLGFTVYPSPQVST